MRTDQQEGGTRVDDRMTAYCGITCTDCDAYKATLTNDTDALERMAEEASKQFGTEMTAADAMCDGCLSTTGRQIGYCDECAIRLCAVLRHVASCAHCGEYPCDKVEDFSKPGTPHRKTLDDMRTALGPR
jgi:hypothetical protein